MRISTLGLTAVILSLAVGLTGCSEGPTAPTTEPSIDPPHTPAVTEASFAQVKPIVHSASATKKGAPAPEKAIPRPKCDIKMRYGAPNPC